jgi:hypothetical protein
MNPITVWNKSGHDPHGFTVVPVTQDKKTGRIAVTWKSQHSCPLTCPLLGTGCYGEHGTAKLTAYRLNSALETDPVVLAQGVASGIRALADRPNRKPRKLRLNIVGDSQCPQYEASACEYYAQQTRQDVATACFSYTHMHQAPYNTPRKLWGKMSILASVSAVNVDGTNRTKTAIRSDIRHARSLGYKGFSVVTPAHTSGSGVYLDPATKLKTVACRYELPQQGAQRVTCENCTLCTETTMQRGGYQAVAFALKHAKRGQV